MSNLVTTKTPSEVADILEISISDAIQLLMIESDKHYNKSVKSSDDENYMCAMLGMSIDEYRQHLSHDIEYIESKNAADNYENHYLVDTTYTTEKEFIDFNLKDIQEFMSLPPDITPVGKYSSQILEDYLYRGIPSISRDVVNEIIRNYKIIDVHEVQRKVNDSYAQ